MTQSPDEARPRVKGSQTAMAAAYLVAIVLGVCSGLWGGETIHAFADFVSSIFIRLFKFISIPIIAVSIIATLASISRSSESGRIFRHTIFYTLFTTILAATLAAVLYVAMSPANVAMTAGAIAPQVAEHSYLEYIQSVIPDNFLAPFLSANVLSVLLVSAAIGIAISRLPRDSRSQEVLLAFFTGAQEVLFILVKWLIRVLPIGIFGFISALVVEMNKALRLAVSAPISASFSPPTSSRCSSCFRFSCLPAASIRSASPRAWRLRLPSPSSRSPPPARCPSRCPARKTTWASLAPSPASCCRSARRST